LTRGPGHGYLTPVRSARQWRVTGNPEVISSPVWSVPINALVLTGLANFRLVADPEVIQQDLFHHLPETLGLSFTTTPISRSSGRG